MKNHRETRRFAEHDLRNIPTELAITYLSGSYIGQLVAQGAHPAAVARILGVACRYLRARLMATQELISRGGEEVQKKLHTWHEDMARWLHVLGQLPDPLGRLAENLEEVSGLIDPHWRDRGRHGDKRVRPMNGEQLSTSSYMQMMVNASVPALMGLFGSTLIQLIPEDSMRHGILEDDMPIGEEQWKKIPFPIERTGGRARKDRAAVRGTSMASSRSGGPVHMKTRDLDMQTVFELCAAAIHGITDHTVTVLGGNWQCDALFGQALRMFPVKPMDKSEEKAFWKKRDRQERDMRRNQQRQRAREMRDYEKESQKAQQPQTVPQQPGRPSNGKRHLKTGKAVNHHVSGVGGLGGALHGSGMHGMHGGAMHGDGMHAEAMQQGPTRPPAAASGNHVENHPVGNPGPPTGQSQEKGTAAGDGSNVVGGEPRVDDDRASIHSNAVLGETSKQRRLRKALERKLEKEMKRTAGRRRHKRGAGSGTATPAVPQLNLQIDAAAANAGAKSGTHAQPQTAPQTPTTPSPYTPLSSTTPKSPQTPHTPLSAQTPQLPASPQHLDPMAAYGRPDGQPYVSMSAPTSPNPNKKSKQKSADGATTPKLSRAKTHQDVIPQAQLDQQFAKKLNTKPKNPESPSISVSPAPLTSSQAPKPLRRSPTSMEDYRTSIGSQMQQLAAEYKNTHLGGGGGAAAPAATAQLPQLAAPLASEGPVGWDHTRMSLQRQMTMAGTGVHIPGMTLSPSSPYGGNAGGFSSPWASSSGFGTT